MRRSIRRAPTASRKCSNASRPQWASAGSPRATDVPVRARCSAGVSRVEATFWLSTGASSPGSASSKGGSSKARCHSLSRVTSPRGGSRTRSSAGALGCSMVRAGLVSPKHRSHAGYVVLETGVTQQSDGEVPEVRSRFRDAVAQGKVYGPYAGNSGENVYRWKACGLDEIAATLHALAPRVATVKRSQAQRALDVFLAQPSLPRGNPAWGSHKTHCAHGHAYSSARIRPYASRSRSGSQRRASKQCLVCVRDQARLRRSMKKLSE